MFGLEPSRTGAVRVVSTLAEELGAADADGNTYSAMDRPLVRQEGIEKEFAARRQRQRAFARTQVT